MAKNRLSQFKIFNCSTCGSATRALERTDRYLKKLCIICFIKGQ